MTKTPIDYSKTIIYKICCKDPNIKDVYVGSTTNFKSRKNHHKGACIKPNNKEYHTYKYQFIRENGGWENWDMIMIKKYTKCESKLQCLKKERKYVEKLNATLNIQKPTRTNNEWREDNKEYIKQQRKQYRENNKELIKQQKKRYQDENNEKIKQYKNEKIKCICGSFIARSCITRHRKTKKHLKFIEQNQ